MSADYSWGVTWDAALLRDAQAEVSRLRDEVAALEAERDTILCALCSAAVHDGRAGRLGLGLLWRAVGLR